MTREQFIDSIKAEARAVNIEPDLEVLINTLLDETLRAYIRVKHPYEYRKIQNLALIANQSEYDLPTDYLCMEDVLLTSGGKNLYQLTHVNSRVQNVIHNANPRYYYLTATKVGIFPSFSFQSDMGLQLVYFQEPTTNFNTNNSPVIFTRFQSEIREVLIEKLNRYHNDG